MLFAAVVVAIGGTASIAWGNHSVFERVSDGEIGGNDVHDAFFVGASDDGARVFFETVEALAAGDKDNRLDVYQRFAGVTSLVSRGQINGSGAFDASFAGASSDGTRVFFSTNEFLVANDGDNSQDIYERSGGTTKRVSVGQINGNDAFDAVFGKASSDGTRIFFRTDEPLVPSDTDTTRDVYERSGGTTKRVSAGQINGNGLFGASFAGASADGTRVFFVTFEQLVPGDTDSAMDVYERSGGVTTLVSGGQINGNGNFAAGYVGASADGTRVFFISPEPLVASDTDAQSDVYERSGGTTKLVSAGQINGNGAFDASFNAISADGTRVFFSTNEALVANDTDAETDIYERSGGTTKRISAGQINGNGASTAVFARASADGSRVFFNTGEQLVAADTDAAQDAYERSGGSTRRVSAGQINGNGAFAAGIVGASADGTRVFFASFEPLVAADVDSAVDIYERFAGVTTRISDGKINGNGAFPASFAGASASGADVFFHTYEPLEPGDLDAQQDVYSASVP
jgi:hypothetical protein